MKNQLGKTAVQTSYRRKIAVMLLIFAVIGGLYALMQALAGLYPFGSTSNLLWDQDVQYADYYAFYREVLRGKADIGYSFSKSLGGSLVAWFGYYMVNPLNLAAVFFEPEQIPLFLFLCTLVKMGLSGVTISVYLWGRDPDLTEGEVTAVSSVYGLMQYMVMQCSNLMWLDGCIFLPLVMLAVYRLVSRKKSAGLCLTVAASIVVNWYTGYMICLFSAFYYLYEYLLAGSVKEKGWIRRFFGDGVRYVFLMLLGTGLSAFLFYPVFLGLQGGKSPWDPAIFALESNGDLWSVFRGFGIGAAGKALPLYASLLLLGFLAYYFADQTRSRKERMISALFLSFMLFSSWFVPLDSIWSGMRRVYSYPLRFGFLVIFLVLILAAKGLKALRRQEAFRRAAGLFALLSAAFFGMAAAGGGGTREMYVSAGILAVYAVVFLWVRNPGIRRGLTVSLLALELTANGVLTFASNYAENPSIEAYQEYVEQEEELTASVKEYDQAPFYRMETTARRDGEGCSAYLNDAMAYGYRGLAHYSSTYDQGVNRLIWDLGYSATEDLGIYGDSILSSDSLLGIRYVLAEREPLGYERVRELDGGNGKDVYENPYALGLGMGVSEDVFDEIRGENPFEYQNELYSNLLGEPVEIFRKAEAKADLQGETVIFDVAGGEQEDLLYGCVQSEIPDLVLSVDGQYRCLYAGWLSYRVFSVGAAGESHQIRLDGWSGGTAGLEEAFYFLDREVFEDAIGRLRQQMIDVSIFEDGYLKGSCEAAEDGYVLLTVPYHEGWELVINGEEKEAGRGAGALTVVPVEKGVNQIEMRFQIPGVGIGRAVSAGAAALLILLIYIESRKKERVHHVKRKDFIDRSML